VALVFLLRIRMASAKLEKHGGKKGVVKKLKWLRRTKTISVSSIRASVPFR
jgi:hypothetical protein